MRAARAFACFSASMARSFRVCQHTDNASLFISEGSSGVGEVRLPSRLRLVPGATTVLETVTGGKPGIEDLVGTRDDLECLSASLQTLGRKTSAASESGGEMLIAGPVGTMIS